jgi:hypothetical protein
MEINSNNNYFINANADYCRRLIILAIMDKEEEDMKASSP